MFYRGNYISRVQHVDDVATGKGRGMLLRTKSTSTCSWSRESVILASPAKSRWKLSLWAEESGTNAEAPCNPGNDNVSPPKPGYCSGGSQRTVGAVIEPNPVAASEKHVVLHGVAWDDVWPYGE